jgi:hypothetical protein
MLSVVSFAADVWARRGDGISPCDGERLGRVGMVVWRHCLLCVYVVACGRDIIVQ